MSKEYQAQYYQKHKAEFQKRHRDRERAVALGIIKRKPREKKKCWICKDFISGQKKKIIISGKEKFLDEGCFQWLKEGRFGSVDK